MQCPVCTDGAMSPIELAPDFAGLTCGECSGVWIARGNYDAWRAKQPGDLPEVPAPAQIAVGDTRKAKICPQCAHLMLPYRIGHGLSFSIDYCCACGGVWCDRDEWDALKAKQLHDNLHEIVSTHWQTDARRIDVQEAIEQSYKRQIGEAYEKAAELRAWLRQQPQQSLLIAYLSQKKP